MSYVKDMGGQSEKRSPPREDPNSKNHAHKKGKNTEEVREARVTCHTLNTIAKGFVGRGETSSTRKRYARSVMHIEQKPPSERKEDPIVISFSRRDLGGVLAQKNDPMVIKVHIRDWSIK